MGDQAYRREVLAWAGPAYFKIINRLSTPGSPAWCWVMVNVKVEDGLIARGVLPAGIADYGGPEGVIPHRRQWRWEEANTP
jgi:hypothetical protein